MSKEHPILFSNDKMFVSPIEFSAASDFVDKHHRHHKRTVGHIFSLGLWLAGQLIGVAVCGRPVSRHYDDGKTIEITRVCVLPNKPNACSKLYGAAIQVSAVKGYKRVITYTLKSENGASLKASNFKLDSNDAGGKKWTGSRKYVCSSNEFKKRWVYEIE